MLTFNKKSQSISINTIIIAAIALAVLVVLFIIFTGRFKIFSESVSSTASCENACRSIGKSKNTLIKSSCDAFEREQGGTYIPGKYDDVPSDHVCCCTK